MAHEFPACDPGELRHSVTFEAPPTTEDATGAPYGNWTPFATTRAKLMPMGGSEQNAADAFQGRAGFLVTIRYLAGLSTMHRMNFGGRLFDLSNINNVLERGRWMVITATEGVSHGN